MDMKLVDIVNKLVGEVEPIGETNEDEKRYANLKVLGKLTEGLLQQLYEVSENKDHFEGSRIRAGSYAADHLRYLSEEYGPQDSSEN